MRGLHSAVLVLTKEKGVKIVRENRLKSGMGGWMGTKGAIAVTVSFQGLHLQIINCHLASGQEQS